MSMGGQMELALLKLHLKHHLLFAVILVVLWNLFAFLHGVSESETFTQYTCLSDADNQRYGFCQERVQNGFGVLAGVGTVVLTLVMLVVVFTWLAQMPTRNDIKPPTPQGVLRTDSTDDFEVPRRLRIK